VLWVTARIAAKVTVTAHGACIGAGPVDEITPAAGFPTP